jgi:putative oxidoreductase
MAAEKTSVLTDLGKLALRLVVGIGIMTHGYPKLFGVAEDGSRRIVGFTEGVTNLGLPYPTFFAWAAALSEFAGGLLLAVGLFTRVAAFMILCTMSVALYRHRADPFGKKELALMYFAPALFTTLSGPGRFSLDALFFRRK